MKRRISLAFLTLMLVSISCSDQPGTNSPKVEMSLSLTVHLLQSKYCLGEPVIATVMLTNVGDETLLINSRMAVHKLAFPSPFRELAFNIKTPHNESYDPIGYLSPGLFAMKDFINLAPQEVFEFDLHFASIFYTFPEIGVYKIIANYQNLIDPGYIDSDDDRVAWKGELNSNEILLTISPCSTPTAAP